MHDISTVFNLHLGETKDCYCIKHLVTPRFIFLLGECPRFRSLGRFFFIILLSRNLYELYYGPLIT